MICTKGVSDTCKDNKSIFVELFSSDCSVSNYDQNIQNLRTEMFKFIKGLSPEKRKKIITIQRRIPLPAIINSVGSNFCLFQQSLMTQNV